MLAWVNDEIIGRHAAAEKKEENHKDDDSDNTGSSSQEERKGGESEEKNQGTLILDVTCAPQNIRFPTDTSMLNEARQKAEEIIDILHENELIDGEKPRTHRVVARRKHNSYYKARKKTQKMIRTELKQQLGYLKRDLEFIDSIEESPMLIQCSRSSKRNWNGRNPANGERLNGTLALGNAGTVWIASLRD